MSVFYYHERAMHNHRGFTLAAVVNDTAMFFGMSIKSPKEKIGFVKKKGRNDSRNRAMGNPYGKADFALGQASEAFYAEVTRVKHVFAESTLHECLHLFKVPHKDPLKKNRKGCLVVSGSTSENP